VFLAMTKKIIYLFLALLLPGLIFLFLKQFGKNEFTIPAYYQQAADSLNAICGTQYVQPYQLADSVLQRAGWEGRPASLFVFQKEIMTNKEFKRIFDLFDQKEFQVVEADPQKIGEPLAARWGSCVFMVHAPRNAVLVDKEKKIRGYYVIGSREETDRLILEIEILLKKY
jgi:hypothetical protein